mgnify:CR=1 FL=1
MNVRYHENSIQWKTVYIRCTKCSYSFKNLNSLNIQFRENSMENCTSNVHSLGTLDGQIVQIHRKI